MGGREGRRFPTGGCGLCSRQSRASMARGMSGGFGGRIKESNVRNTIGECNCRLLDAL